METSAWALAELLAQIGRAAYCMGAGEDLTPGQRMALRYFSRANRFSRTASAFADYHATTRGTASQTVRRLVERGYLTRRPSVRDRRSVRLELTEKGREALSADPFEAMVRSVDGIPRRAQTDMARRLEGVLEQMARAKGDCLFGTCPSCRHLEVDNCALFDERLQAQEMERICVNFSPMTPAPPATPTQPAR